MADFFIRRPIVAIVISILIVLLGLNALRGLSVEQYPFLAPPTIRITATYPGASAVAVEQSVATPVEQEVNGVEGMIYMKSSNTSDGRMQLDVNFGVGTDQDMANVLTQNRVSSAQARLPQEVIQQGVTVKKQSPSILMVISLYSPDGSYDADFLINYCGINLRDQILRIPGIAQVDLFGGTDYGMRIWLRPDKLAKLGLTPSDVIVGDQGAEPPGPGRAASAMRPSPQGPGVHVHRQRARPPRHRGGVREHHHARDRDRRADPHQGRRPRRAGIAELRLVRPAQRQARGRHGRLPAARREPAPGRRRRSTRPWSTAKEFFPADMDYKIVYDTTPAVEASIESIVHTFVEAIILVTLVVFIFLQNLRATIIPLLTVPVSLIGTFIFFPLLGFSVNTLSMFGLVLAIGIVVDDAIVVVEAVMHHIEHGKSPQRRDGPGDEGGVGAGHRHRADPLRRVHPGGLHPAASPAGCTSSSR